MNAGKKNRRKMTAWILGMLMLLPCATYVAGEIVPSVAATNQSLAAGKTLTLSQAKSLALSNSSDYVSLQSKLALAEVQYTQAVKSLQLKKKNMSTFRWTPLLNFKFPEQPDFSDSFEFTYKPLEMQSKIDTIQHQITDNEYAVYEEVSLLFVECYTYQESITFTGNRIDSLNTTLEKNQAKLLIGEANQSDIDKIESNLEALNTKLLNDMRNFENAKDKLGKCINLDVTSGYTFQNPYVESEIDRSMYEDILEYTLERDESYYEAQVATQNALLTLDTDYQLMKNHYGSKMGIIDSFVQLAKNGEKVDSAAFKLKYDEFLEVIEEPWQGSFRILFVKIPKEWSKGSLDGVRYIEDEPYALYEAVLEYQDACLDEEQTKEDVETQVKDGFDNYISVRGSYEAIAEDVEKAQEELDKSTALNLTGQLTYEELSDLQTEFADLQMDELDALAEYTKVLVSYDRLTCGAITLLLDGTDISLNGSSDGMSYIVAEEGEGAYYYIHALASSNAFEFGVYVPDDFSIPVDSYELWVNGMQIGERSSLDETIHHLALSIDNVDSSFVRFYNGDEFVDDCVFDPEVYSGKLAIAGAYEITQTGREVIASYTYRTNASTGMVTLEITNPKEGIASYDICSEDGSYLAERRQIAIDAPFLYLGFVTSDMENLHFCFYDEGGNLLYTCAADTQNQQLYEDTVSE